MEKKLSDRDGWIWFDGEMVPWRDATIHVLTHSLHYGLGVFEGVRAYSTPKGTAVFRIKEHTKRFVESSHIMGIKMPFTAAELITAQKEVIKRNNLTECYIRPLCFLGSDSLGLRVQNLSVHVAIATWAWPDYMSPESLERGIKVRTSSYTRHYINSNLGKSKTSGGYVNSLLALREALDCGCEEALMLDTEGYAAEGSGENIFILRDDVLHTPEKTTCLPGITRETIIQLAADIGIETKERKITRDEVYIADEAFFTGTAVEIMPIRELDSRQIGSGKRGPITTKLQQMYLSQVRGDGSHPEWLSLVTDEDK